MKVCVLFALFLFATNPAVKPDRKSDQADHASNQEREPSVVVVNNDTSAGDTNHGSDKAPRWDASVWANWALVAVGLLTFYAVWKQAKETAEATKQMARSADLQALGFRQWVDIENWRSVVHIEEDGTRKLHIQFDLVNPTQYKMTLKAVTVTFDGKQVMLSERTLLPPNTPHTVAWEIEITDEQIQKWGDNSLVFHSQGQVLYEDALGDAQRHPFGGLIAFGKDGGELLTHHGAGIYLRRKKTENSPDNKAT